MRVLRYLAEIGAQAGLVIILAGSAGWNAGFAQDQSSGPTFTAEQADRGHAAYRSSCQDCHGSTLDNGEFGGPPLTGLSCDFSPLGGPATGTAWEGVFLPGDAFECTAVLSALAAGLTGRTPRYGFHLPEMRRATLRIQVEFTPTSLNGWGALGGVIGRIAGSRLSGVIGPS